ncbi:MAG: hypothetical protein GYB68_17705 [Chloroflexi bacterium]|nr:hypothetical protein [Chloroflexota bacterium]
MRTNKIVVAVLALLVAGVLVACGGGEDPVVQELPTQAPDEEVGAETRGGVTSEVETTWENYLRDIIAAAIVDRNQIVDLFERYRDPNVTVQDIERLVTDITLVEDRTEWNTTPNSASSNVEFDVRLAFANGDSDTRTCRFDVFMEQGVEDELWYIVNPAALAIFSVCN